MHREERLRGETRLQLVARTRYRYTRAPVCDSERERERETMRNGISVFFLRGRKFRRSVRRAFPRIYPGRLRNGGKPSVVQASPRRAAPRRDLDTPGGESLRAR